MNIPRYNSTLLFEQVPDLEKKTMLDLGAGQGQMSRAFIRAVERNNGSLSKKEKTDLFRQISLFDIIYNPDDNISGFCNGQDRWKDINTKNGKLIFGDVRVLPFKRSSFDIVALGYFFDQLTRLDQTGAHLSHVYSSVEICLHEANRVLKPDGYIVGDAMLHPRWLFNIRLVPQSIKEYIYDLKKTGYEKVISSSGFELSVSELGRFDLEESIERSNPIGHINYYFVAKKIKNASTLNPYQGLP